MRPRLRLLAALLALSALSASLAETVWASTCAPMTPPAGAAEAPCADMATGCAHAPGDHGSGPSSGDGAPCPFAALAASGCAAVFLPPAATAVEVDPADSAERVPPRPDRAPPLLLAVSLFRPPRA